MTQHNPQERLDHATSSRLAKLSSYPVDTAQLQQSLEQAMDALTVASTQEPSAKPASVEKSLSISQDCLRMFCQRWWRPISTCAAAILIALSIGWFVLGTTTSQAMAAPAELAQIHYDVAHGLSPHMSVTSVDQANAFLSEQSDDHIPLPIMPGQLQSCCLHHHAGTVMTCAMIENQGQLITVAIADGSKIKSPQGQVIVRDGKSYIAHKANGINMVMTEQTGRWLCVMGEAPFEQLIDVASTIRIP